MSLALMREQSGFSLLWCFIAVILLMLFSAVFFVACFIKQFVKRNLWRLLFFKSFPLSSEQESKINKHQFQTFICMLSAGTVLTAVFFVRGVETCLLIPSGLSGNQTQDICQWISVFFWKATSSPTIFQLSALQCALYSQIYAVMGPLLLGYV